MEKIERMYILICNKLPHMFVDSAYCNMQSNCRDCIPIDYKTRMKGIKTMAMPANQNVVSSNNGLSELVFLSELKKLSDGIRNDIATLKTLLEIVARENTANTEKILRMLQRPNVLNGAATTSATTTTPMKNTGFIVDVPSILAKLKNSYEVAQFISDFRAKHTLPLANSEIAEQAIKELWKTKTIGKGQNGYWPMAVSKTIVQILVSAFTGSNEQKASTETISDKTTSEYWCKTFKITEEKLTSVAEIVETNICKSELQVLGKNLYFSAQDKKAILESFGDKNLASIYPPDEVKDFLSFMVQFVVKE